jgi:hypothetical protein
MNIYKKALAFRTKYPITIAFRLNAHSKIIEKYINEDEKLLYVFTGQKNNKSIGLPNTFIAALTDKRLLFARKRVLFGSFFYAITPDMFNDLKVESGLIWGKIIIDTVKELVTISNIDIAALNEIETNVTQYMMEEKKKYNVSRDSK